MCAILYHLFGVYAAYLEAVSQCVGGLYLGSLQHLLYLALLPGYRLIWSGVSLAR